MPDYKKVHYRYHVPDVERELDRLSDAPDIETIVKLEGILETLFQQTQRYVHVDTGSLKMSGDRWSDNPRGRWRARITYGGQNEGINNPVKYAPFERERGVGANGRDHDFMRPAEDADFLWYGPVRDFLSGH